MTNDLTKQYINGELEKCKFYFVTSNKLGSTPAYLTYTNHFLYNGDIVLDKSLKVLELVPTYEEHQALKEENERLKAQVDYQKILVELRKQEVKTFQGFYTDAQRDYGKYKTECENKDLELAKYKEALENIKKHHETMGGMFLQSATYHIVIQALSQERKEDDK